MLNIFGQKKWIISYFWNTWVHISLQVLWEGNTFIGKEKYIFDDWWKILSFPGGVDSKSCHHSLSISDKCPQLARRNFRVTNTGKDISYMIKHTYGRYDLKKIWSMTRQTLRRWWEKQVPQTTPWLPWTAAEKRGKPEKGRVMSYQHLYSNHLRRQGGKYYVWQWKGIKVVSETKPWLAARKDNHED